MIFSHNKDHLLTPHREGLMRAVPKLVLMLIAFNVLLYANPDKLNGKWNIESSVRDGEVEKLSPEIHAFMEFNKDTMTYTMGRQGKIETRGTWKMEADQLILIEENSPVENIVIIKFDGDKCTLSTLDGKMVVNLRRLKPE